jgi:glycosyltransferase involved in cell wall biosynthesis
MSTAVDSAVAQDDGAIVPKVSVVVSTRNRATKLARLFGALADQSANGRLPWELVLVDNGSTDDTERVAKDLCQHAQFTCRYIFEARRGKSHGLNTGIATARGQIIALTDDDGVPAPNWLESLWRHFELNPLSACVGGRVELFDPTDAPVTLRLSRDAAVVDAATFTAQNIPIIGCNMAVRASAFVAIGQFDVDIGPGGRVGAAEDLDILYRLIRAGHRIHFDPTAVVRHNHGRRTREQVEQTERSYVVGRGAFYCKHMLRRDLFAWRMAYWELRGLFTSRDDQYNFIARMRHVHLLFNGALRYVVLGIVGRRLVGETAPQGPTSR